VTKAISAAADRQRTKQIIVRGLFLSLFIRKLLSGRVVDGVMDEDHVNGKTGRANSSIDNHKSNLSWIQVVSSLKYSAPPLFFALCGECIEPIY
jgi:hypothetical protein